jgi:outer membrane protein assembly factor BamB
MRSPSRLLGVLLVCLAGLLLSASSGSSQDERPLKICGNDLLLHERCGFVICRLPRNSLGMDPSGEPVVVAVDRQARRRIDTAKEYLRDESWPEAVQLLQAVLDAREDSLIEADDRLVSARAEAERLLGSLPPRGREYYQVQCGGRAAERLREARAKNDPSLLAEVAQRYLHTRAGAEALALLGALELDRGRPVAAADCYRRLLHRESPERLPPAALFQAAAAFRQAGDALHEEIAWRQLTAQAPHGLRLGKEQIPLQRLRKELDRLPAGGARSGDWTMFRGDPARTGHGTGSIPYLEPRWQLYTSERAETRRTIEQAVKYHEQLGETTVPALFPIAVGDQVIYRAHDGIHAVALKTGRMLWKSSMPLSFDGTMNTAGMKVQILEWMRLYGANSPGPGGAPVPRRFGFAGGGGIGGSPPPGGSGAANATAWVGALLYSNCVQGTLSTDRRRVYAVEDLPLPLNPELVGEMAAGAPRYLGPLRDAVHHNRLRAIDRETGKLVWEVGGRGDGELDDCYFLGPPLPLGGKLYALIDKSNDLRLVCLDPEKGSVVWAQTLATYRDKLLLDARRRVQAVPPSYADGILVCPTGAGAVIGFELLTRSLLWVHTYRGKDEPGDENNGMVLLPLASLTSTWRTSAPIIHNGKVIFTAPDGGGARCLNLRDGTLLWKAEHNPDDLYLAAVCKDRVLLVGREHCRALNLADGKLLWQIETGTPAGQGVAAGNLYFLPLKRGAVCAIDLEKREVSATATVRGGAPLGNLLFHHGELITQTPTQLAAFPELKAKLAEISERISRDPRDPVGLTERGAMRLDEGNLPAAVADLRTALANNPPAALRARAQARLHEALTQWLERDFPAAEKHLDEYHELCRRLDEPERRLATYHGLVARGRERQGRLAEALRSYRQMYELSGAGELLAAPDDAIVKARPDAWAQGRIASLLAQAAPEQRRALEEEIARAGKELRARDDLAALERFVALFGGCDAGREARLELAERLIADPERGRFLEAELHLLQLRDQAHDPVLAARAVEALARLMARKGLLDEAMHHYRALARDYGRVVVRDGKTGADLFADLASDKRFVAHYHAGPPAWTPGRIKAKEEPADAPLWRTALYLEPDGEVPPFLQRHRLVLDLVASRLRLLERATGAEVWTQRLALGAFNGHLRAVAQQQSPRIPIHTVGHLAVVHLGFTMCGIDLIERRVLWQRKLFDESVPADQVGINFIPDAGWELFELGHAVEPGKLLLAGPSVICLESSRGLVGLDPLTGDVLWTREEQLSGQSPFGGADYVYALVTSGGTSRAVRARDGGAETLANFPPFLRSDATHRVVRPASGGQVLVWDSVESKPVLRLYDPRTGKDVWAQEFPSGSRVVTATDPALAAVLDPAGNLSVLEIRTQKLLLQAKVNAQHIENLQSAHLLHDATQFYLALEGPAAPNFGATELAVDLYLGFRRGVPVHGMLYAFDRQTGKVNWANRVLRQTIVQDHFEESPIVVCAAWQQRTTPGGPVPVAAIRTMDKKTGKTLYDKEVTGLERNAEQLQPVPQFHALHVDPIAGTVDLIGRRLRIRHANAPQE